MFFPRLLVAEKHYAKLSGLTMAKTFQHFARLMADARYVSRLIFVYPFGG
jgi:hypothetical protein